MLTNSKQVYLYGIAGAEKQYKVIAYQFLVDDDISIRNIVYSATMLKIKNPEVERVFAIDNRKGLRQDYQKSITLNTIESCYIFRDILETEGLEVI